MVERDMTVAIEQKVADFLPSMLEYNNDGLIEIFTTDINIPNDILNTYTKNVVITENVISYGRDSDTPDQYTTITRTETRRDLQGLGNCFIWFIWKIIKEIVCNKDNKKIIVSTIDVAGISSIVTTIVQSLGYSGNDIPVGYIAAAVFIAKIGINNYCASSAAVSDKNVNKSPSTTRTTRRTGVRIRTERRNNNPTDSGDAST
jgi:hypothetical protein